MASTRRPRTINRPAAKGNEGIVERDEDGAEKGKQRKRKLSDMLGPPWSKDDLEVFYVAYRKHGRDWNKVAKSMHKRTVEMVEALYGINRAYLSLPEGAASATGLIAMMTDHYNILDSEEETSEEIAASDRTHQLQPHLRSRAGRLSNVFVGPSGYGGPSPAKKPRSAAASRPRVVGKRTPRYPVGVVAEKKGTKKVLGNKSSQEESSDEESDSTKVAEVALTLATASQRVNVIVATHTPTRRSSRTLQNGNAKESGLRAESGGSGPKLAASTSGEVEPADSCDSKQKDPKASSSAIAEEIAVVDKTRRLGPETKSRWKKPPTKKLKLQKFEENLDDPKEESSRTGAQEDVVEDVGQQRKKRALQRATKRSRQLFSGAGYGMCLFDHIDQNSALDALATLANLSLNGLLPSPTLDSDSSAKVLEEKMEEKNQKSEGKAQGLHEPEEVQVKIEVDKVVEEIKDAVEKGDTGLASGSGHMSVSPPEARKRKRKVMIEKLDGLTRTSTEDMQAKEEPQVIPPTQADIHVPLKARTKPKRATLTKTMPKQGSKANKSGEPSTIEMDPSIDGNRQVAATDDNALPLKLRSKKKGISEKCPAPPHGLGDVSAVGLDEEISKEFPYCSHGTTDLGPFNMKARLIHCLSPKVQRWCVYEWFYSAIDLPWFARNEFVEYLNHAGLGHVPRLTRVEWGVIRSSLGKPRRLSKRFLQEERDKLEKYRESVRIHYHELRTGVREGLPLDLARPLAVGQRVIARHPRTRQIHDGSILTVDRSRCRVQFDRPELGVELVMDFDAMPVHPLENMPEGMRRKRIILDSIDRTLEETKFDMKSRTAVSAGGAARAALNERLERPGLIPGMAAMTQYFLHNLTKKAQGNTIDSVRLAKVATNEAVAATQQALISQPFTAGQSHARETDIRALVELGGALNKKEALVVELRRMNDEAPSHKGSELFKRQYATIILQLKEVNEQVLEALKHLRHRNKYQDNAVPPWYRAPPQGGFLFGSSSFADSTPSLDPSPPITEIVVSARRHAKALVAVAVQTMASLNDGDDPLTMIGGALDLVTKDSLLIQPIVNGTCLVPGAVMLSSEVDPVPSGAVSATSDAPEEPEKGVPVCVVRPRLPPDNTLPTAAEDTTDDVVQASCIQSKESVMLSDLMASCVATLLMVQTLTDRQFSAADVAFTLDGALERLRPKADQNNGIFKDIEQQIGFIKTQILAQIPVQSSVPFPV